MNLETVGKLVAQHSSLPIVPSQNKIEKAALEQALVKQMLSWIMWGMMVLGVGIVMLAANKYFDLGKWFGFVSGCLLLGGTGIATFGLLNALRQGANLTGMRSPLQVPEPTDVKSLPTSAVPASLPSVTERTTQLIPREETSADALIDSNRRE